MRGRRLAGALALVACVRGPTGAAITPIDIGQPTAKPPVGEAPPAKGTCQIQDAKSTLDLKVRAGDESFDLRIIELPTESEIDRDGNAIVHVRADVQFEGRLVLAKDADAAEPSLQTSDDVVLLGGLVRLHDAEILSPRRLDDTANGVVLVGGYEIEDLAVPCDKLRIDGRATVRASQLPSDDGSARWVTGRGDVLAVCTTPGGSTCIRTRGMTFEELRRQGSALEVRARFDDGGEIHGWADADQTAPSDEPEMHGYGTGGGCGCGRRTLSHLRIGKPDPREHFGRATLRAGSTIYATAELQGPWAKAVKDVEIEIAMHGESDHASVRDLPGVSTTTGCTCPGMSDHAFVKRESVVPIR